MYFSYFRAMALFSEKNSQLLQYLLFTIYNKLIALGMFTNGGRWQIFSIFVMHFCMTYLEEPLAQILAFW